jgi:choline dehydrogenase-like flavoprotein
VKKAIVVGSGVGGATVARELQGRFQVTVLEAGGPFHPFAADLGAIETVKRTGLLFDEREIGWLFPNMVVRGAGGGMIIVNGVGSGGTTTLSAGNAVRCDGELRSMGIDLDAEFEELYRDIPVTSDHQKRWHPATQEAYRACLEMGLQPKPTPKMVRLDRCSGCGKCVLGCSRGAKWDSRVFLDQAVQNGAELVSRCTVKKIVTGKRLANGVAARVATGVIAGDRWNARFYPADLVVLAAGALGTPLILERSGIACRPDLFVDPVLCVAGRLDGSSQNREMPMPFIVQRDRYMISPYFDFLSFFFNRRWKAPAREIFSLMIKLADDNGGAVGRHSTTKPLSDRDRSNLNEAVGLCTEVFRRLGKKPEDLVLGTLNAGHPGATFPLTSGERHTLHSDALPSNVYVADASLLPKSPGNPPILTIAALAKRIGKLCA